MNFTWFEIDSVVNIIQGIVLTFSNALIFATILHHKALRTHKEYGILGLLVFFNALLGIGFVSVGVSRIAYSGIQPIAECVWAPHILIFAGTPFTMSFLLPFIAVDRLMAVTLPIYYYYRGVAYPCITVFLALTLHFTFSYFGLKYIGNQKGLVRSYCDSSEILPHQYRNYEGMFVVLFHLLAVVLYLIVIRIFQNKTRTIVVSDLGTLKVTNPRRTRIVETLGRFALATFMFVVLPLGSHLVADFALSGKSEYTQFLYVHYIIAIKISLMNPTVNVLIYSLRHNDICIGMKTMMRGQTMPDSTAQWRLNNGSSNYRKSWPKGQNSKHLNSLAHHQMMLKLEEDKDRRSQKNIKTYTSKSQPELTSLGQAHV